MVTCAIDNFVDFPSKFFNELEEYSAICLILIFILMLKKVTGLSVNEVDGKTVITAPKGASYLSEFMDTLPNGILNKKETGCGATTVVLENSENVIVACPNRQLIINKVAQYPNERCTYRLLAVKQGVTANDVETYINECNKKQPVKIMVTYDSFPKVNTIIKQHFSDYKVVVDEYQEILDACIYRNKAIKNLLLELKEQTNVTYLSATPIPYKFKPKELEQLPEYEIEWSDVVRVIPFRIESNHPFALAANIIKTHKNGHPFELEGKEVKNYFFFVNSVTAIRQIAKAAKLAPDEVKIICAKNEINKEKLKEFSFGDATGTNKTFTFCTKSAFYGVDFHSEAGLAIIVSDRYSKSSLLDVSTDIIQISGRIRTKENPFKNLILHIYNTGVMCQSRTEFEEWFNGKLDYANKTIEAYQALPQELRCSITERIKTDEPDEFVFYNEVENQVELDELKIAHAQYKFEAIDNIYTNGLSLREAYVRAGYNVENSKFLLQSIKNNVYYGMGDRFERYYKMYSEERRKSPISKSELAKDIEYQYDIISKAYDILGDELVEKLNYNESKVRNWVHFKSPITQAALKEELRITFKLDELYSFKEIKYQMGLIFQKLRIEITATAKMLTDYFIVKQVKIPKGEKEKRGDGYKIINTIFFFAGSIRRKVEFIKNAI